MEKVAILGAGREGKSIKKYLLTNKLFKKNEIDLLDQKTNPNYLDNLEQYKIIFRSPGIYFLNESIQKAVKKSASRRIKISSSTKLFFEKCPCKIIGITGTKGKTTTATLLYKILKNAKKKAYLTGNIGKPAINILNELDKDSIVVLELSSFQLQDMVKSPEIGVVLDITPDHQDVHKSFEEYVEAKSNIARHQGKNDIIVFSSSNEHSAKIAKKSPGQKIGLSLKTNNEFLDKIKISLKLPGTHNLKNAYFAATAAKIIGIPEKIILKTIKQFKSIQFRIQKIKNNPEVYNDSASTNPEAAIAAIKAINPDVLIMGGLNKNLDYKNIKDVIANSNVQNVFIYGSNRFELEKLMPKTAKVISTETLKQLFSKNKKTIKNGKRILFSPASASLDQFKNYKERGKTFNRLIKQYL